MAKVYSIQPLTLKPNQDTEIRTLDPGKVAILSTLHQKLPKTDDGQKAHKSNDKQPGAHESVTFFTPLFEVLFGFLELRL